MQIVNFNCNTVYQHGCLMHLTLVRVLHEALDHQCCAIRADKVNVSTGCSLLMVWRACVLFLQTAARVPHSAVSIGHPFTQGHAQDVRNNKSQRPPVRQSVGALRSRLHGPHVARVSYGQCKTVRHPGRFGCLCASAQTSFSTWSVLWHLNLMLQTDNNVS